MMQTKTIIAFAVLILGLISFSCQGPDGIPGPQGPEGPQGPAGSQPLALMYEVEFNLNAANQWESFYTFPAADEIFTEDVVLTYLLWDQVESEGETVDVWRAMPVHFYSQNGTLAINYDFTVTDVRLFAEASYPMTAQNTVYDKLLARIVVVPADYSPNGRKGKTIDYNDYEQVRKAFNLPTVTTKKGIPARLTLNE